MSIEPSQNDKHKANISPCYNFREEVLMDSHREFLVHIAIIVIIELSFKIFVG